MTSCCGKYIHTECAARFLGKECKNCKHPWSRDAVHLLRSYMEWMEVKNLTSRNQAQVRRTIEAIDRVDEFQYKWVVIDRWGCKGFASNHEDLWNTYC